MVKTVADDNDPEAPRVVDNLTIAEGPPSGCHVTLLPRSRGIEDEGGNDAGTTRGPTLTQLTYLLVRQQQHLSEMLAEVRAE